MNKKILIAGFIVFVILLVPINSAYSNIGIQIYNKPIITSSRGNTLYVGGSGLDNYSKIQDAIDNASDGDTVFVYDDSSPYNEWNIRINKSINLIGEDMITTVINGNHSWVIEIYIDSVNISGFTIIDADPGIRGGYYNLIISNNRFINCESGVFLWGSRSYIISNHFVSCYTGVIFWGSRSYIISNSFSEFDYAIRTLGCVDVTISDNLIINSTYSYYDWGDISCYEGSNYVITNNTLLCDNPSNYCGLGLNNVNDSIIEGNRFIGYGDDAIMLLRNSCNNTIIHNNITGNRCGISISDSLNNIITHNNIIGNKWGISISNSYNNIITHNNFNGNECGISISKGSGFNRIINNNFINNKRDASTGYFLDKTHLDGNYWDKWIGLKYKLPIFQRFPMITFEIIFFNIDWHPAKEPYNI